MNTLYIIYDRVSGALVALHMYAVMQFKTDQQAARYFADAINDTDSMLNTHPGDYELRRIGSIDDKGNIVPTDPLMNIIITGDALIATQQSALVKEP